MWLITRARCFGRNWSLPYGDFVHVKYSNQLIRACDVRFNLEPRGVSAYNKQLRAKSVAAVATRVVLSLRDTYFCPAVLVRVSQVNSTDVRGLYMNEGIERTYISSTPAPLLSTSWPPYIQSLRAVDISNVCCKPTIMAQGRISGVGRWL